MKKALYPIHQIELRLTEMAELFNSMDPTPFHHRNLDIDAEDFLESWALDFPQNSHFKIIIHIEKMPVENPNALVEEAIHNHFYDKAVKQHAILSRLVVETASNSFHLSMSPSSVLAGGFWSDLYGYDLRNTQALFSTKTNDYSHRQRHGAFPSHRTQTHSYC